MKGLGCDKDWTL